MVSTSRQRKTVAPFEIVHAIEQISRNLMIEASSAQGEESPKSQIHNLLYAGNPGENPQAEYFLTLADDVARAKTAHRNTLPTRETDKQVVLMFGAKDGQTVSTFVFPKGSRIVRLQTYPRAHLRFETPRGDLWLFLLLRGATECTLMNSSRASSSGKSAGKRSRGHGPDRSL